MDTPINKTILITGATDGLGKRVAEDLAKRGATILLHGRNRHKGEALLKQIREETGNPRHAYYNADFASLAEVHRFAEEILSNQSRLDVLINNAGIGPGFRQLGRERSAEGHELRFAVNYLAHYVLTYELLPLLRKSAPARIVNVSSIGQYPIDFDDLHYERGYDGFRAYRKSKLAQVMFTIDLAEELKGSGVTVNALHPASLMDTKMVLEGDYLSGPISTIEQGARAVEYLATAPELESVTGEYFDGHAWQGHAMRSRAHAQAYDPEARRKLRDASKQLTGVSV